MNYQNEFPRSRSMTESLSSGIKMGTIAFIIFKLLNGIASIVQGFFKILANILFLVISLGIRYAKHAYRQRKYGTNEPFDARKQIDEILPAPNGGGTALPIVDGKKSEEEVVEDFMQGFRHLPAGKQLEVKQRFEKFVRRYKNGEIPSV